MRRFALVLALLVSAASARSAYRIPASGIISCYHGFQRLALTRAGAIVVFLSAPAVPITSEYVYSVFIPYGAESAEPAVAIASYPWLQTVCNSTALAATDDGALLIWDLQDPNGD